MSYYVDKEKAMKLANLHIEALKTALGFTDEIKEVLQKFDGKPITKRIDTALKKINPHLYTVREYNSFRINWIIENRYFCENGGAYYIKENTISILWATCFSSYGDNVLDSENCLIAEQAIKELDRQNEQTKESIKNATEQLANIENAISEHERIKKELESFNRSVNWLVNSYFELRID